MNPTSYTLLWVVPKRDAAVALDLAQLDAQLKSVYATVMMGVSLEREPAGQAAVCLHGKAELDTVVARLEELGYQVVDSEKRAYELYHSYYSSPWYVGSLSGLPCRTTFSVVARPMVEYTLRQS